MGNGRPQNLKNIHPRAPRRYNNAIMSPEAADILKFLAFGAVWLFPIALMIAVLGFASADAKARRDDPGPNVVPFPARPMSPAPTKPSFSERLKRLAFPRAKG